MKSRRSFFADLATLAGAAIIAPQVLVAQASDAFRWKKTITGVWVVNPEWVNAPFEMTWFMTEDKIPLGKIYPHNFPLRFRDSKRPLDTIIEPWIQV